MAFCTATCSPIGDSRGDHGMLNSRSLRQRLSVIALRLGRYFTHIRSVIVLVWQTSPIFFIGLLTTATLTGLLPLFVMILNASLLTLLVQKILPNRIFSNIPDDILVVILL